MNIIYYNKNIMAFAENIENWRLIDGYDNYEVSSHGRVRNNVTSKILKTSSDKDGYYYLALYKNKTRKTYKLHRLIAFAFCDNPNNYNIVDHIDKSRINNMFNNLRWVTVSENQRNRTTNTNNTSGKAGVHKDRNSWQCRWRDTDGGQYSKSFSIKTYGDEQAKVLAVEHRRIKEVEFGYL
jgi:hypothetical protein